MELHGITILNMMQDASGRVKASQCHLDTVPGRITPTDPDLKLVGGLNLFEKNSQIGNIPQMGVNIKKIFETTTYK